MLEGTRFTENRMIAILNKLEVGMPVSELCQKHRVSDGTIYNWRMK